MGTMEFSKLNGKAGQIRNDSSQVVKGVILQMPQGRWCENGCEGEMTQVSLPRDNKGKFAIAIGAGIVGVVCWRLCARGITGENNPNPNPIPTNLPFVPSQPPRLDVPESKSIELLALGLILGGLGITLRRKNKLR